MKCDICKGTGVVPFGIVYGANNVIRAITARREPCLRCAGTGEGAPFQAMFDLALNMLESWRCPGCGAPAQVEAPRPQAVYDIRDDYKIRVLPPRCACPKRWGER